MSVFTCPQCGTALRAVPQNSTLPDAAPPDMSVVEWFRGDPGWTGEMSTDEVYGSYLRWCDTTPVSRARFVADLAYLGVEQVLDDETQLLVRS